MFQKLNLKFIVIFALIATWSSTSMPVWALSMDDLVMREAIYYEKFSNIPFTGAVDEGNEKGVFRGGKKDGQWLLYSSDGQLLSDVTYADGKRFGTYRSFHPNGKTHNLGQFDNQGRMHGNWIYYSRFGDLTGDINYKHGKLHGSFKKWYVNGQPDWDCNYHLHKVHGQCKTWFYDGSVNPIYTGTFHHGKKIND